MLDDLERSLASLWDLDPGVVFLNHGSFGATPRAIMARQRGYQEQLEREPVRFFVHEWRDLLDASRERLARFVGARADDLAFVPNATHGVNTVLNMAARGMGPGDELVITNHGYGACNAAARYTARRTGATLVIADIPAIIDDPAEVVEAVMAVIRPGKTKLLLIDHITSPSGLVLPLDVIVPRVQALGVDVLVDGAHTPGHIPLDLDRLGAAYYTGNCHKWLCAPKGAALLHVRADRQEGFHPLVISHGHDQPLEGRSRFHEEFDWMGTADPSPFLCVGDTIDMFERDIPGGWAALQARNHRLAIAARDLVADALGVGDVRLAPDAMCGSMTTVPLPDGPLAHPLAAGYAGSLPDRLLSAHNVEAFLSPFPAPPRRLIRLSAQLYNSLPDYRQLARALRAELDQSR
jgi:isopenicillin-N epimerase